MKLTKKPLLTLLAFIGVACMSACLNPCRKVDCHNGGTCDDGECICTTGYSGEDCTDLARDQFLGNFSTNQNCDSGNDQYTITIDPDGTVLDKVWISNIYNLNHQIYGSVTNDLLEIPEQPLGSATISGSALYSSTSFTFAFELKVNGASNNCTAWTVSVQ